MQCAPHQRGAAELVP